MKQNNKLILYISLFHFFVFLNPLKGISSDIVNIFALNSRIVVVHFDDGYVHYHQKKESRDNEWVVHDPLNTNNAEQPISFEIKASEGFYSGPKNPVKIERKSKGTEFTWLCNSWSQSTGCINSQPDHAKEHWLYLYLPEPLETGKKYEIRTGDIAGNGKIWEFDFNLETNRTEAVHVNLVGYDPRAPKKFGYVYHWGGSAGSINFSEYTGNNFYLIDNQTKEKVFTGKLAFRKSKTNVETRQNDTPNQNFLGADVWECDFSDFNTQGEYILAVEGVGHSFPFKIKPDAYRHAFYNSIRGLYHNRSGIALEEPFTEFIRPAPHNPIETPGFSGKLMYSTSRFIDWNDLNHSASDLEAIEDGILGAVNTWGWYQDAGDWDGYFWHMKIPVLLMLTWEIAPEKFADGELNLPEGVNGIPDILDEARWLIRFFHRTRHELMEKGYGSGGIGSRVAPDWYGHAENGTPSYEDTGKWVISGEDPFTTYFYAGLAGHYAAVLNKLGMEDQESIDWQKEAEEAYSWALDNTKPHDTDPLKVHGYRLSDFQMYAAASLYRLTGNESYVTVIEQNASSIDSGTVLDEDKKWGTYSLVVGDEFEFPNQNLLGKLKNAVIATADQKNNSVGQRACRYGGNIWMPMVIGQGTTPRVFEMMMGHYISREVAPAKTDEYFTNLFTTADYFLGCNPLNMTWITHVGVRYPERVLHIDSWYNGRDEMAPGITPYGPWRDENANQIGPWSLQWPYKTLYPDGIDNWPGHERWFNNYTTPANAEFTVHQNTVLSAVVYGYLCDEPDGSYEPNKHPSVQLNVSGDSIVWEKEIPVSATAADPNGENDIAWVEFYNDWHKIGQSNKPPYLFSWKSAIYGKVRLSAKVVDKSGYSAKSEEINVEIIPPDFKVSVEVKDSITGEVLAGSEVKTGEQIVFTDMNGVAVFDSVNGRFSLHLSHDGYKSLNKNNLEVYSDTLLTFQLSPYKKDVAIAVFDQSSGDAFTGVVVLFNSEEKVTSENGEVVFQVYNGEYDYFIEKNSFKNESGTVTVNSDTTFHFYMVRTEAEIKIALKEGTTPVNGATVIVNNDTLLTTALGIARFKNLAVNASYSYYIYKPGFYDIGATLYLTNDTTVNVAMAKIPTQVGDVNQTRLKVWPNPVNDELYFTSDKELEAIVICSVSGIKIRSVKKEQVQSNTLKMSFLKTGLYLVKFEFYDGSSAVKTVGKN